MSKATVLSGSPGPAAQSPPAPGQARPLVAEDDEYNFLIPERALRWLGFSVERAIDGLAVVRKVDAAARGQVPAYDLVLIDVKVSGLDAHHAVREIREIERQTGGHRVAVVALTFNIKLAERPAAIDAEFDEYIVGPIEESKFADTIFRALAHTPQRFPARRLS